MWVKKSTMDENKQKGHTNKRDMDNYSYCKTGWLEGLGMRLELTIVELRYWIFSFNSGDLMFG